jgi:hypothetical protein
VVRGVVQVNINCCHLSMAANIPSSHHTTGLIIYRWLPYAGDTMFRRYHHRVDDRAASVSALETEIYNEPLSNVALNLNPSRPCIEELDWEEYLSAVHIPGLIKHALKGRNTM